MARNSKTDWPGASDASGDVRVGDMIWGLGNYYGFLKQKWLPSTLLWLAKKIIWFENRLTRSRRRRHSKLTRKCENKLTRSRRRFWRCGCWKNDLSIGKLLWRPNKLLWPPNKLLWLAKKIIWFENRLTRSRRRFWRWSSSVVIRKP